MSATAPSSAEAGLSASAGLAGVDPAGSSPPVSASSPAVDSALPVAGSRWRGKYDILEQVANGADVQRWTGRSVESGQEVALRAFRPLEPEIRAQAWSKLGGIDSPHLQHARDAQKAGDWRIEVADLASGIPLPEWRAKRGPLTSALIREIVSQIGEALGALHAFELVHLNLRPEAIRVNDNGATLTFVVQDLDALTSFDRKEAVPAVVDPFYAPPEEVGLARHVPGPGLCAWDWWSLGRIVQELILGHHVVAQLAQPTVPTPQELRARAEALLAEADPKAPRAGAVETMPDLDANVKLLLRGLLTSSKEARWTGDNVDRWIRGLPVKEHYDTPRKETHLRWRGRPYLVQELATTLQSAESWAENSVQLFEASTPGTLAHFLRWAPNLPGAHEQLTSALELADSLPLKLSSPAAQREAVTMVALLQVSGGKLIWRGRPVDGAVVAAMMTELGEADAMMVLRSLATRSTALQIERIDPAAGRFLTELGRTVGDVESILKRYGWLNPADTAAAAGIFRLAVEPIPTLRAAREALTQKFAGSDHPAMEKLFKAANLGRVELVVLGWAAGAPETFKFYSHAEAARRRAAALRARGVELVAALTWAQYERALQVGRLVFGGWGWFVVTWFLVGSVALVLWPGLRGLGFMILPGVVATGVRLVVSRWHGRALAEFIPDARWSWRDGPDRCRRELRLAGHGVRQEVLESELANLEQELSTLSQVQPPPVPLPKLPRFGRVRLAGALSWVLLVAFGGVAGWRLHVHPLSVGELKAVWAPDKPAVDPTKPRPAVAAAKSEDKAEVKISWPYRPGDNPVSLSVRVTQPATPEQIAYATTHGRDLVAPYRPESINTPIILPVPAGDDAAVMLFDGKRGELANQQVYLLEFRPIPRSWVELGGHRGVYLDQ